VKHGFIDRYSNLDSFLHRLDPRTKTVTFLALVVVLVAAPPGSWPLFALFLVLTLSLVALSRVPPKYVLARSAVVIPFAVMVALFIPFMHPQSGDGFSWSGLGLSERGLVLFGSIVAKAWLSVLVMVLLSATTPFPLLLKGLEELGMPRVFILILSFMYRYIFVLADEAMRMKRAWESRAFGQEGLSAVRTIAGIIGVLFIRSYERAERVYGAMLARGFDGQVRTLKKLRFGKNDFLFGSAILAFILLSWALSGRI